MNAPFVQPSEPDQLALLLGRVARRDETALAAIYDDTADRVYGLAVRIVGEGNLADEVTADTFFEVWQHAGRFQPSRGSASSWLLTIARNRAIDKLRARRVRTSREDLEELPETVDQGSADPQACAMSTDQAAQVQDALATLSTEQRQVIELAFYGGLTHCEIARDLDQPLGTVKTRIRAGIAKLTHRLRPPTELL